MKRNIESAPSITRVHTLHRIRTIVNYVNKLNRNRTPIIDDLAIAKHLIDTHLSKPTTESFQDQIGRRARDHLETARYLGLLSRIKKNSRFTHIPTLFGKMLEQYKYEDECPKDYIEESIFIDRVCRLKLSNVSYMQTPRGYESYRTRICLNILYTLKINNASLSIFQLGSILSNKKLDPFFDKTRIVTLCKRVKSISYKTRYLNKLTTQDIKNIRRDILPFIDWGEQLNLLRKNGDLVLLTDRGIKVAELYSKMMPLWWEDFKYFPQIMAAVIILINYLKSKSQSLHIQSLLNQSIKWGLFNVQLSELIKSILKKYPKTVNAPDILYDFSFEYDIPPDNHDEIINLIDQLIKKLEINENVNSIIKAWETYCIKILRAKLYKEVQNQRNKIKEDQNIYLKTISPAVLYQIKSPYEATTYIQFKAIESEKFKIDKYQAQLSDFFINDPKYKSFSKNNPDLLLTNNFYGLVECKSKREWGDILSLRKAILSEIEFYDNYCSAINKIGIRKKCIAIICYEGDIRPENKTEIKTLLMERYQNIIIITNQFFQKLLIDNSLRNHFIDIIEGRKRESLLI
jgi:hypothetical protein